MTISEDQLKAWAAAPSDSRAVSAYGQINDVLNASPLIRGKDVEIYLQGSYGNRTNIKVDSDIDIVVQLNRPWCRDISRLSPPETATYLRSVINSDYGAESFKLDVARVLKAAFGDEVDLSGKKSIKLKGNESRLNADIVPALQYRVYESFSNITTSPYIQGIEFKTTEGTNIINFPKLHMGNGEDKNSESRTGGHYKHLVRVLKNIKGRLVEDGTIDAKLTSSYFIEAMVFNVPDVYFSDNYQKSLESILYILLEALPQNEFMMVNDIHTLFGDEPWQWNDPYEAGVFLESVKKFIGI